MMRKELLIGTLKNETINFRKIPDERVGKYGAKSASQLRFQIRATAKTRATDELRAERTVGAILWNEGITLAQELDGPHVESSYVDRAGDHERLRWVANVRCREKLNGGCGSTSVLRAPINGGALGWFNVGPDSGHEETAAKARRLTEVRSNADIYTAAIRPPVDRLGFPIRRI